MKIIYDIGDKMIVNVIKLDENGKWYNTPMTIEEWIKSTDDENKS